MKLYNCNAHYDEKTLNLTSYATEVVTFATEGTWDICTIFRASMTTMQHIRKYVEKLNDLGFTHKARLLEDTYIWSIRDKRYHYTFALNNETGEVVAGPTKENILAVVH